MARRLLNRPKSLGVYAPRDRVSVVDTDARYAAPNSNGAGVNDPAISVGPTSSTNAPGNLVMSAWSGWPDDGTVDGESWGAPWMEPYGTIDGGGGVWSGFGYGRHSPEGFGQRVSVVGTCVDLIGRQLATWPAYGVRGRRTVDLPSWYESPEPQLYSGWVEFMKAVTTSYLLAGEAIIWATGRYSSGYPARFIALNPRDVHVDEYGVYRLGGATGDELDRADICHIRYQVAPGASRRGVGPLQWAGRHLVSAGALDAYSERIARLGVWAILSTPDRLTAEQASKLKSQWVAARERSTGEPAVLSGNVSYDTVTMSPKDMALLDLKVFDWQMIASAFGVPAALLNLPTDNGLTYQTAVMNADWLWRATLRAHAESIASALSLWALPHGTRMEFNPDRFTQPPLEERARAWQTLHGITDSTGRRAMTIDEIRVAERLEPSVGVSDPMGIIGANREEVA